MFRRRLPRAGPGEHSRSSMHSFPERKRPFREAERSRASRRRAFRSHASRKECFSGSRERSARRLSLWERSKGSGKCGSLRRRSWLFVSSYICRSRDIARASFSGQHQCRRRVKHGVSFFREDVSFPGSRISRKNAAVQQKKERSRRQASKKR